MGASTEPALRAYAIRCVSRSGAVSGGRIRSTSTATAADAGISVVLVCEEGLGHRRKRGVLDPHKFFSGGTEDCDARQRHRFGEHADDEKVVFDVVHAVVAADNLGLVNGTDDECRRMPIVLGRSG
jgi:hypothetical protein